MVRYDFKILERQITNIYRQIDIKVWTAADYYKTIKYFMLAYEKNRKKAHFPISNENLQEIMYKLPFMENESTQADLWPDDYVKMIDKYFNTKYKSGCDYNIYHFISDGIRTIKFYECCY